MDRKRLKITNESICFSAASAKKLHTQFMYTFLDTFFFILHSGIILFILFGWLWQKARRLHLFVLLLTAFSWFFLGIWYGIGYCPCTDWHWQVRTKLGYHDMPASYVKFLIDSLTGIKLEAAVVDAVTLGGFLLALSLSIWFNLRDLKA